MKLKWNQSHWSLNHCQHCSRCSVVFPRVVFTDRRRVWGKKKGSIVWRVCLGLWRLYSEELVWCYRHCVLQPDCSNLFILVKSSVTAWLPVATKCSFSGGCRWRVLIAGQLREKNASGGLVLEWPEWWEKSLFLVVIVIVIVFFLRNTMAHPASLHKKQLLQQEL